MTELCITQILPKIFEAYTNHGKCETRRHGLIRYVGCPITWSLRIIATKNNANVRRGPEVKYSPDPE